MTSTTIGVVAALIGLSLLLRGYATIRAIISLFGALVGFVLGAYVMSLVTGHPLFADRTAWIGAAIGAAVCGLLAFLSYRVAVIGGIGAIGWTLGGSLAVALHVTNHWVGLALSLAVAVVLAVVALRIDLPGLILVLVTVLGGASVTTLGTMLALGKLDVMHLGQVAVTRVVMDGWGWYALYLGLVVLGLAAQWRYLKVRNPIRTKWGKR